MAAMRYLSERYADDDILYIHSTMREHYKFYSRHLPISGGHIIKGTIGWPCCPRGYIDDRRTRPAEVVSVELDRLGLSGDKRHIRLLFTGREGHWKDMLSRNDSHEFEAGLAQKGCFRTETKTFPGVRIDEYFC
jgi:hypothetical protein